ncbi:hypothetical protein ACLKA7_006674 [Drosophila subpalustris]
MNISQLLQTYQDRSGEQTNRINEYVARALLHVVHSHILSVTPSLVLTLCCRDNHTCNFYNEMMSILFRSWGIAPLQIVTVEQGLGRQQFVAGRRHYNLIFTDSYAAFAEIEVEAYSQDYNYNEYYYIFLQARDHLLQPEMRRIFAHCWRHQLINCNVQVQMATGEIRLYTYLPFGDHSCANMTPTLINYYNGTHMHNPLQGSGPEAHIIGGLEGHLLLTLGLRLNFSVVVQAPPRDDQPMSHRGMKMLQRNEVDLCLGSVRQTVPRSLLATSTHSYHQTSVRFGVLDTTYKLSSFDILLYPYPTTIWLAIGGVFALGALVQLVMDRVLPSYPLQSVIVQWLNLELMFVGMPMMQTPSFNAKRIYCIMLMLYTLLIRTVYQGKLYHLIRTHQLNRLPQSIDELVDHNYTVVLSDEMHEMIGEIPTVQYMQFHRLGSNSTPMQTLDYLATRAQDNRLVAATGLNFFKRFNRLRANEAQMKQQAPIQFKLIPEDVIDLQVTMYLRKHSFLIDEFNDQIIRMRSVGLLELWARWELDLSYLWTEQALNFEMLGLQQLYAIFLVVLSGLLLSTLLFLLELLSLRSPQLQRWFLSQ